MTNSSEPGDNFLNIPNHIAFIMDGNRRWAARLKRRSVAGHAAGARRMFEILEETQRIGIKYVSVFAFSHENNKRDKQEVTALMTLMKNYINKNIDSIAKRGVQVRFIGDIASLGSEERDAAYTAMQKTRSNSDYFLQIALNYGSRQELFLAAKSLAEKVAKGIIEPAEITIEDYEAELFTKGIPDVDLVIRTSGEIRTSNFLLYQSAYAEYIFDDVYWPDFDKTRLHNALIDYSKRERRFGGSR